jgi:hypothetical protein
MNAMSGELAKSDAERGLCQPPEWHKKPMRVGFGAYHEKLTYTEGCLPVQQLLAQRVGAVCVRLDAKEGDSVLTFMRTPAQYLSNASDRVRLPDPEAGDPSDFLLHIHRVRQAENWRFLTLPVAETILAVRGQQLMLPAGITEQGRPLEVPGRVVGVSAFR